MAKKQTKEKSGSELYEEYLASKKAFSERVKSAVDYLVRAGKLNVSPERLRQQVESKLTWATSHPWRYCEGHESVYCTFMVGSFRGPADMVKVVVPLSALDITAIERETTIIDQQITELEAKRKNAEEQMNKQISGYTSAIEKLISKKKELMKE